jgi:hypothetical protein
MTAMSDCATLAPESVNLYLLMRVVSAKMVISAQSAMFVRLAFVLDKRRTAPRWTTTVPLEPATRHLVYAKQLQPTRAAYVTMPIFAPRAIYALLAFAVASRRTARDWMANAAPGFATLRQDSVKSPRSTRVRSVMTPVFALRMRPVSLGFAPERCPIALHSMMLATQACAIL